MGVSGWFRADLEPSRPDAYKERFEPLPLADAAFACEKLTPLVRDPSSPILVMVHGVGGDAEETEESLPLLMAGPHASIFLFRWVSYDSRDAVAARLAAGISKLSHCVPSSEGRLLILAHSAGGVLSSFAASRIQLPAATTKVPWLTILTVASPLSGTMARAVRPDGAEESALLLDFGTAISTYPAAAPGVRVVHLRSQAPADSVMTPYKGHVPNNPKVGVPGAPQLDLPDHLSHNGALVYVAGEIAADRWKGWRDGSP